MTLTGGYDLCMEIAQPVLRLAAAPLLAAPALREPTIPLSFASGGRAVSGTLRLFVTSFRLAVDAGPDPVIRLTLGFERSALAVTAPATDSAGDLAGSVELDIPLALTEPVERRRGLTRDLVLDLAQIRNPSVVFRDSGYRALEALAARLGIDRLDLFSSVDQSVGAVTALVASLRGDRNPVLTQFRIAPDSEDGSISPLRFVDVTIGTARAAPPSGGRVLVVFGTLVRDHADRGEPRAKTEVAGGDATVVLAPDAFRRLQFCPQVLRALLPEYLAGHVPDDFLALLPDSTIARFGWSREQIKALDMSDRDRTERFFRRAIPSTLPVDLTAALGEDLAGALPAALRELLRDTRVARDAILPPECGRAEALRVHMAKIVEVAVAFLDDKLRVYGDVLPDRTGITGRVEFSADVTLALVDGKIEPTATEPEIRSSIRVETWARALSLGFFFFVIAIVEGVAQRLARNRADQVVRRSLEELRAVRLALPAGVTATAVAVTPQGLVVRGSAPPAAPLPLVELPEVVVTRRTATRTRDLPERTVEVRNDCVQGTFRAHERQTQVRETFEAATVRIAAPVAFQWRLEGHRLEGDGVIESTADEPLYHYTQADGRLELWNEWGTGRALLTLTCRATGADGTTDEAELPVSFPGPHDVFEPAYTDAIRPCVEALADDIKDRFATAPEPRFRQRPFDRDDLLRVAGVRQNELVNPGALGSLAELAKASGRNPVWLKGLTRANLLGNAAIGKIVRRRGGG